MIRDITFDDYDELLTLAKGIDQFKIAVFADADDSCIRRTFALCVHNGFAKVVVRHNKIIGCMFGVVKVNHWGVPCSFDLMTYSTFETPKLLRLFIEWSKLNGAKDVIISNTTGSERYNKLINIVLKPNQRTISYSRRI